MNLRHLAYLVALAREGHFGRAATTCHITQPSLSAAILQLEHELGVPLVRRTRQRFDGLTPEGHKVLDWAREISANIDALKQSLGEPHGVLRGHLRIGAIPTAEPTIATFTERLLAVQPNVRTTWLSRTADEITRGLVEHSLDAGISYTEGPLPPTLASVPIYTERYVMIGARLKARRISWADAATQPLVLLPQTMQNRRLLDTHFAAAGVTPTIRAESDTLIGVLSHVRTTGLASIVPAALIALAPDLRGIALVAPEVGHTVALLYMAREPRPPLVNALIAVARSVAEPSANR